MMQKKVLLLPNLTKHNTAELVPKIIRQLILCGCQPLALTEYEDGSVACKPGAWSRFLRNAILF